VALSTLVVTSAVDFGFSPLHSRILLLIKMSSFQQASGKDIETLSKSLRTAPELRRAIGLVCGIEPSSRAIAKWAFDLGISLAVSFLKQYPLPDDYFGGRACMCGYLEPSAVIARELKLSALGNPELWVLINPHQILMSILASPILAGELQGRYDTILTVENGSEAPPALLGSCIKGEPRTPSMPIPDTWIQLVRDWSPHYGLSRLNVRVKTDPRCFERPVRLVDGDALRSIMENEDLSHSQILELAEQAKVT